MKTYYEILGVSPRADDATIRMAFRKAAKTFHPDLHGGDPSAAEHFKQVTAAHAVLTNPEQRAAFDQQLRLRRQLIWREWKITLASWAAAGLLSAGLAIAGVWVVGSMLSLKPMPRFAAPAANLATEPSELTGRDIGREGNPGPDPLVAHSLLIPAERFPAPQPLDQDQRPAPTDPVPLRREPLQTGIAGADPAEGVKPAHVSVAEPSSERRAPEPIAAAASRGEEVRHRRSTVTLIIGGQPSLRQIQLAGSQTHAQANGPTANPGVQGSYIFYERAGARCGTDGAVLDLAFAECGGQKAHRLNRRRRGKEGLGVRRGRVPRA
jgi:hypothetical protein